jgi:hypothetical protein
MAANGAHQPRRGAPAKRRRLHAVLACVFAIEVSLLNYSLPKVREARTITPGCLRV